MFLTVVLIYMPLMTIYFPRLISHFDIFFFFCEVLDNLKSRAVFFFNLICMPLSIQNTGHLSDIRVAYTSPSLCKHNV